MRVSRKHGLIESHVHVYLNTEPTAHSREVQTNLSIERQR